MSAIRFRSLTKSTLSLINTLSPPHLDHLPIGNLTESSQYRLADRLATVTKTESFGLSGGAAYFIERQ
jgi:hypothetical protein